MNPAPTGGTVQTVLGPVDAGSLGRVLPHEHLLSLTPGPFDGPGSTSDDDRVETAVRALRGLQDRGYGTVVDLSPYGVVGRDERGDNVVLLAEISRRSGLHVVAGTALYLDTWTPAWARGLSEDALVQRLERDVRSGIGDTTIRAGVLGEQATGLGSMTDGEARNFRAAARTAVSCGVSLFTHTTHGTLAVEQVEMLRAAGCDLGRVVIGHIDTQLSLDLALRIVQAGACVAVDTIGKQEWDFFLGPPGERRQGQFTKDAFWRADADRAEMVAGLVRRGYADRVLLSMDATGAELWMNVTTHGRYGYTYVHDQFRLALLERGVTDRDYDTMTVANPARLLATHTPPGPVRAEPR